MAQQQNIVRAERTRRLPTTNFDPGNIKSVDIPRDSVYKSFSITMSGGVAVTFTGTYTVDALVSINRLLNRIDIVVNGNRTVKSVTPWLCSTKVLYFNSTQTERKSSAAASVLTPANPLTDAGFTVGTTGQVTTIRETIDIFFEDILSTEPRQGTFLNLKGAASAEIRLNFAPFSQLEAANNAATGISYGSNTLVFEISTREAPDLDGKFADLKETTKSFLFTGEQTEFAIDINRGNYVRGIWLQARDGGVTKPLSNTCITGVQLIANGFFPIKQYGTATSAGFLKIQAENRSNFGMNVPLVNSVSRIDGIAYIDLLNNRNSATALDARFLDNLQLLVSTAASGSGATYTNAVELTVQTDEYVLPA